MKKTNTYPVIDKNAVFIIYMIGLDYFEQVSWQCLF